jgi:DNA polymerase III subunit gamma/tau
MSYLVLARKWRPKTFGDVVGQATVTRTLQNAIATGRIGHAFLFSGARGVGKTTAARILARALNCNNADGPTAEPCARPDDPKLACPACHEIWSGTSLDVQEIDGASNNGVEQVRELRESARYNPARDRFKIWIIDEVHMLSMPAFNALLKTLEEPPPRVKFIFATTEYHKLPDTILSRCQQYDFRLIPAKELVAHLRDVAAGEGVKISEEALARIARAAEGSARDALSLFDQVLSFSGAEVRDEDLQALLGLIDRELLLAGSQGVAQGDSLALLDLVERLSDYGADLRNFTRELTLHFRDLLLLKVAPEGSRLLAGLVPEERERLRPIAEAYSEEDLLRAFEVLTKAETDLRWAQDPRVTLELALLKLAQLRRLMPFAELVDRVEQLASGVARPAVQASGGRAAPAPRPETSRPAASSAASSSAPPPPSRQAAAADSAAPPEAAGAPRGPVNAQDPAALLEAMLAEAQRRPSLLQPLRGAAARLENGVLVIEVPGDFAAFAEHHAEEYRELAAKAAGRPLKVRVAAASAGGAEPAGDEKAAARRTLVEQASQEPAVQEALEIFKGRIVDVREA